VRTIRPSVPDPVPLAGTGVRLSATWRPEPGGSPTRLAVRFVTATGEAVTASLGPLDEGRHEYSAPTPGCGPQSTCRLVSIGLAGTGAAPATGSTLVLHELAQSG